MFSGCSSLVETLVSKGVLTYNFVQKRLLYRCFPVNFAKFLRIAFFITPLDGFFCSYWNELVELVIRSLKIRYIVGKVE